MQYKNEEYLKVLEIISKYVPGYYILTGKANIYPDMEHEDMRDRLSEYIWNDVFTDINKEFDKIQYETIMDIICDMINDVILYKVEMIEGGNRAKDILTDLIQYGNVESTLIFILSRLNKEVNK